MSFSSPLYIYLQLYCVSSSHLMILLILLYSYHQLCYLLLQHIIQRTSWAIFRLPVFGCGRLVLRCGASWHCSSGKISGFVHQLPSFPDPILLRNSVFNKSPSHTHPCWRCCVSVLCACSVVSLLSASSPGSCSRRMGVDESSQRTASLIHFRESLGNSVHSASLAAVGISGRSRML
jgi:hypothetical protein